MRFWILLIVCLIPQNGFAKDKKKKDAPSKSSPSTSTVALTIETGSHGSGSYQFNAILDEQERTFLLDTGSRFTAVEQDRHFSKYKINGFYTAKGLSGKSKRMSTIIVDEINVGGVSLKKQRIALLPEKFKIKNLFGMDTLWQLCVALRHKDKTLTFKEKCDGKQGSKIAKYKGNLILLEPEINGQKYRMLLDSGASVTVLNQDLAEKLKLEKKSDEKVKIVDSSRVRSAKNLFALPALKWDGVTFTDIEIIYSDLNAFQQRNPERIDGIIGFNVIDQADWVFDLPNSMIHAEAIR